MKVIHVVCGIIHLDHTYVIARRGPGIHENIWEFPGGKVEQGESNEDAVVREIREELAIDVSVIKHMITVQDQRDDVLLNVHAYLCHWIKGEISLSVHHEWQLVTSDTLNQYTFEQSDMPIIEAIQVLDE